ncbi:amino acid ABC transporter permease [Candidatus Acetothermia bacterium]|nr:MAG: amino acid ABC transporter permease [Candidatus Acetothermia bacterium]HHR85873.1 amino acid ABC transporter permease [Candidatus Acetothermia bacterium]
MSAFIHNFLNIDVMYRSRIILLMGLKNTVLLALASLVFASLLGLFLAVLRELRNRPLNLLIIAYVDLFRALPTIVLFMIVYYMTPYFSMNPPIFWSAVITLSLNGAAYFEEIFRAGIESISKGQTEASRSLGLTYWQTMRHVILPQAVRVVLPPATSNSLELVKTTVLASVISMPELMYKAQQAYGLMANPTPLITAALIFLVMLWPFVRLTSYLERRMG